MTKFRTLITVAAAIPLLALGACSASCHCPDCTRNQPAQSSTIVNPPPSSTTVITPNQY